MAPKAPASRGYEQKAPEGLSTNSNSNLCFLFLFSKFTHHSPLRIPSAKRALTNERPGMTPLVFVLSIAAPFLPCKGHYDEENFVLFVLEFPFTCRI
jgi:hypothetical protein